MCVVFVSFRLKKHRKIRGKSLQQNIDTQQTMKLSRVIQLKCNLNWGMVFFLLLYIQCVITTTTTIINNRKLCFKFVLECFVGKRKKRTLILIDIVMGNIM